MNKEIEVGKRIKARREELNMTQEKLGNLLWLNKSTIQRYESGKIAKIKLPVLHAMAKQLNVDPNWLALKTDDMGTFVEQPQWYMGDNLNADIDSIPEYDNIRPVETKKIPFLGEIACGEPIFANEEREYYVEVGTDIKADFCLKARGDSMINARINDGDLVFVRKQSMVDNGEIAVVVIDDEATLKRVYYNREQQQLMLVSENPKYPPFVYTGEQLDHIHILGKAVAFQSDIM